jgi:hypothetical protein
MGLARRTRILQPRKPENSRPPVAIAMLADATCSSTEEATACIQIREASPVVQSQPVAEHGTEVIQMERDSPCAADARAVEDR